MNKKTIKIINEKIEILKEKFQVKFEYDSSLDADRVFLISSEDDLYKDDGITIEAFLKYTEQIDELIRIDNSSVRCGRYRQTIVKEEDNCLLYSSFPTLYTDNCKLSIKNVPFLIGIIAIKEGFYWDDMGIHAFSSYSAIELEYLGEKRMSMVEENEMIDRYLYYVSSRYSFSVSIGTFVVWSEIETDKTNNNIIHLEDIPAYTKAMNYYIEALASLNQNVRFLAFYKVLEYFSPMVSKKDYYEVMNKRLDAMNVIGRSYEDLNEVFELAKKYEKSQKDSEIPITILSNCVDVETLFVFLPNSIQLRLKKNNGLRKEDGINSKIDEVRKELSSILYSTRNNIVHAKSNYQKTGFECSEEDMEEMNVFMDKLCQCIIVWNGRQAENYRLK